MKPHTLPGTPGCSPRLIREQLFWNSESQYEVDPLLCSRYGATMKVIAVIEDEEVIYRSAEFATKPRAPPRSVRAGFASPATPASRELSYEPIHDDLPWPDPA